MRFVSQLDRLIQAGGLRVSLAVWAMAVISILAWWFGPLPLTVSKYTAGLALAVGWMRFRNITIAGLIGRIIYTQTRDGDLD